MTPLLFVHGVCVTAWFWIRGVEICWFVAFVTKEYYCDDKAGVAKA